MAKFLSDEIISEALNANIECLFSFTNASNKGEGVVPVSVDEEDKSFMCIKGIIVTNPENSSNAKAFKDSNNHNKRYFDEIKAIGVTDYL